MITHRAIDSVKVLDAFMTTKFQVDAMLEEPAMTKLTETRMLILSAGAHRVDNITQLLPKELAGAAAKVAVNRMIALGWLQEVDANLRRGEPLWRETSDGHETALVVMDARLLVIGIEPMPAQTMTASHHDAAETLKAKPPTLRAGTTQTMLIAMLQAPTGATMQEIITATG